ncbi:hypothetical protein N0V82_006666 [Gnomoniopsis sp. IMI 355080]|nr:hypothetical protein N0V82_006666 [Gnomoniopsis sp. IMI 355080]
MTGPYAKRFQNQKADHPPGSSKMTSRIMRDHLDGKKANGNNPFLTSLALAEFTGPNSPIILHPPKGFRATSVESSDADELRAAAAQDRRHSFLAEVKIKEIHNAPSGKPYKYSSRKLEEMSIN